MKADKPHKVAFEVGGPAAMFTRPDTGSTRISYPMPTYSAAKGMFDAVAWLPHAYIQPTRVEICTWRSGVVQIARLSFIFMGHDHATSLCS